SSSTSRTSGFRRTSSRRSWRRPSASSACSGSPLRREHEMKRLVSGLVLALLALAGIDAASSAAAPSTLCVGGGLVCYATLQAAGDAAHDGDTITIAPGTYSGGVAVDVSVDIRGAGADRTTISGGGPVLTLGKEFASTEPTISLSGVTVTGGVNTSLPGPGGPTAVAHGGGIRRPPSGADGMLARGATVTIRDSGVTHHVRPA